MSFQLTPEVEAGLRAEAATRGVSEDVLLAEAVAAYLRSSKLATSHYRHAEMHWAANPDPRLAGGWVVLEGSEVIASGSDPKAIFEEVRAKGVLSPFVIYVSPDDDVPFAGGWVD